MKNKKNSTTLQICLGKKYKMWRSCFIPFNVFPAQEREAAAKMFKGKKGHQLARNIGKKAKTFVAGAGLAAHKKTDGGEETEGAPAGPDKQDIEAIKVRPRSLSFVLIQLMFISCSSSGFPFVRVGLV